MTELHGNIVWLTPQQLDEARLHAIIAAKVEIEMKVLARTKPQAPDPSESYIGKYRPPRPGKRRPTWKH